MRRGAVALALVLFAGCGSTVPNAATPAVGSADEFAARTDASTPDASTATTATPSSSSASARMRDASRVADPRRTGVNAVVAAPGGPAKVGFVVVGNNAAVAGGLGVSGINNGDERADVGALVAAANKAGGLDGHKIEAVFHDVDPASTQDFDTTGQKVCEHFTVDEPVIAVQQTGLFPSLAACLGKKGVVGVAGNPQSGFSTTEYAAWPSIATMGLATEPQASALVGGLTRLNFFAAKPKVGVVTIDNDRFRRAVRDKLLPAVRAAGATVEDRDIVYGPNVTQTSDVGSVATAMSSAVLRMRSDGVTHVMFLDDAAAQSLFFLRTADSQGARFEYGMTSTDAPQFLVGNVSADQLSHVVAIGWDPYLDVSPSKAGTPPPGRTRCKSALASLNLAAGSNAEWIAYMHCDALEVLTQAGKHVIGALSTRSLATALGAVGTLTAANVHSARITADHRWSVAGFRLVRFDGGCGCFGYVNEQLLAA